MQVIAHRGVSAHAPENTIAAFDMAVEIGADAIETDIRITKDGILVLSHDPSTGRICEQDLTIEESSYSDLKKLDLGKKFSSEFEGETIVTLDQFLERYSHRIPLCLEIKAANIEEHVLRAISKVSEADIVITSFEYETLKNIRVLDNRVHLGYLVWNLDSKTFEEIEASNINQVCPNIQRLTPKQLEDAREKNLGVRVWGVGSDPSLMQKTIDMKVDGLTVDDVPMFQKMLKKHLNP
jgi:glycerophosphoryl diester phosphodiesterase